MYLIKKNSYGSVSFTLSRLIERVLNNFNNRYELKLVEDFISQHPYLGISEGAFKQSVETININIRWINKNLNLIGNWLEHNVN